MTYRVVTLHSPYAESFETKAEVIAYLTEQTKRTKDEIIQHMQWLDHGEGRGFCELWGRWQIYHFPSFNLHL